MTTIYYLIRTYFDKSAVFDYFYGINTSFMGLGANIRTLREQRNIKQQEIADLIGMHRSNYSKIETEQRESFG